ncbi:uncharacterized protein [Littorina saxatilis]|uniref:Uncharacterized protein n=1 Tax=Littorina saxatilis TaxID=31220 RepID=A0AAN9C2R6_9CAEN
MIMLVSLYRAVKQCFVDLSRLCPKILPPLRRTVRLTSISLQVFGCLVVLALLVTGLFMTLRWLVQATGTLQGTWRWVECQTLYDFNHLMIQAGIHYFMFGTTLLGSWRHHGLLPAEQNVQVAVSFDTRKDLKKILKSLEPDHVLQRVTPYRWMLLSREMPREVSSLVKRPVHIDINFYNLTDTHVLLSNPLVAKRGFAYPKDKVFPLTYRPFQGTHFPAPNDTMAVLMATYDLDLCEVAPCHDLVKTQESTCLEMPCEQLEEIYPFTRHEMNDDGCCEEFLIYHWRQINKVVLDQSREQC